MFLTTKSKKRLFPSPSLPCVHFILKVPGSHSQCLKSMCGMLVPDHRNFFVHNIVCGCTILNLEINCFSCSVRYSTLIGVLVDFGELERSRRFFDVDLKDSF